MPSKWEVAQKLEPLHWLENKEKLMEPSYRQKIVDRSIHLQKTLAPYLDIYSEDLRVLEIGGAATPLVDHMRAKHKYAIDPLSDLYKKEFSSILSPDVHFTASKAEELDFETDTFDLIICRNVLDHVEDLDAVLSEMKRVTKPGGIIYVGINVFSGPLLLYRTINKDKEHPYTFSHNSLVRWLKKANYNIISTIRDSEYHMGHFDEMESQTFFRKALRSFFLAINSYHFSEFIVKK